MEIRDAIAEDKSWIEQLLVGRWHSRVIVSRGFEHDASALPGLVAELDGEPAGLLTYRRDGDEIEIVTIDALRQGVGVGSALVHRVLELGCARACRRIWLVTTNDNLESLRFYMQRGFRLVAVHPGAVDDARRVKPSIPEIGRDGIPLHDEVELVYLL